MSTSFQEHQQRDAARTGSPGTAGVTTTTRESGSLVAENRKLAARNTQLAELLSASRAQLSRLNEQIEALGEPPSTYGIFLGHSSDGQSAEVHTQNRHMRVAVSPTVDRNSLTPGTQVRLGQAQQILEATGYLETGELAIVREMLDPQRAIIADQVGNTSIIRLCAALLEPGHPAPKAGDTLLVDLKSGYAFEHIPANEVASLSLEEVPDVTYADIGGLSEQINAIHDAIELPFSQRDLFATYDLRPPKGVLLFGPPGCGKTLIAKAVAHSLAASCAETGNAYFLSVKGPELLNKYVGETERQIRSIFQRARELSDAGHPVIVFFDEMESIFRTRGSGRSSDVETTVVPQLLTELDGVEELENVIIIGATNREDLIDPAILRPGRLDVKIRVNRPDKDSARDIFSRYITDSLPLADTPSALIDAAVEELYSARPFVRLTRQDGSAVDLNTSDFVSGAMIANIVDRAKKLAIKSQLAAPLDPPTGMTAQHLREAIALEESENETLPNTSSPEEWSRLCGQQCGRVTDVARISS